MSLSPRLRRLLWLIFGGKGRAEEIAAYEKTFKNLSETISRMPEKMRGDAYLQLKLSELDYKIYRLRKRDKLFFGA